jgi:hypothetical protein
MKETTINGVVIETDMPIWIVGDVVEIGFQKLDAVQEALNRNLNRYVTPPNELRNLLMTNMYGNYHPYDGLQNRNTIHQHKIE